MACSCWLAAGDVASHRAQAVVMVTVPLTTPVVAMEREKWAGCLKSSGKNLNQIKLNIYLLFYVVFV